MAKRFERAGRRLDRELDRIIRVLDNEARPAAQMRSARLLAAAARALDKLANSLRPRPATRRRKKSSR